MLVYATALALRPDFIETINDAVARWIGGKVQEALPAEFFDRNGASRQLRDGSTVFVTHANHETPFYQSIRYSHMDKEVAGRQWITEIGIKQEEPNAPFICTILLKASDISTRVDAKIRPTRPALVNKLLETCNPISGTPGLSLTTLTDDPHELDVFSYFIESHERRYPIVLISPLPDNAGYVLDVNRLELLTRGLADIVVISPELNSYRITDALGQQFAPFKGAIKIIFPYYKSRYNEYIPTFLYLPAELQQITDQVELAETEVFSMITHRMNLNNSRLHVTPEIVQDQRRKRELNYLRKQTSGRAASPEYVALLEAETVDLGEKLAQANARISELENEIGFMELETGESEDKLRQLRYENDSLRLSLGTNGKRPTVEERPSAFEDVLLNVAAGSFTVEDSLITIEKLFPDRVVILNSAWESARESSVFREKRRAFELLYRLVTDYWEKMVGGNGGDAEARQVFGQNAYAANESETTSSNRRGRQLRTFLYKGEPVYMGRHLRFGVKDSLVDTLRIHFEWDAEDKKIVIGWAGGHLDFR